MNKLVSIKKWLIRACLLYMFFVLNLTVALIVYHSTLAITFDKVTFRSIFLERKLLLSLGQAMLRPGYLPYWLLLYPGMIGSGVLILIIWIWIMKIKDNLKNRYALQWVVYLALLMMFFVLGVIGNKINFLVPTHITQPVFSIPLLIGNGDLPRLLGHYFLGNIIFMSIFIFMWNHLFKNIFFQKKAIKKH